eukprot:8472067-Prorocentrum_lima.AAC.1
MNLGPTPTPCMRATRDAGEHYISDLCWCDNRDMLADPSTKGKTKQHALKGCAPTRGVGSPT